MIAGRQSEGIMGPQAIWESFNEHTDPDEIMRKKLRIEKVPAKTIKSMGVKTFKLNDVVHVKEYTELYPKLHNPSKEFELLAYERRFIEDTGDWVIHIEWLEYEIKTILDKKE